MSRLYRFLCIAAAVLYSSGSIAQAQTSSITVSLTPSSASLTAGQSTTFVATVQGTNLAGVAWSFPQIGALAVSSATVVSTTAGTPVSTMKATYTAPASISAPQAVTLVVTSYADPTKTASATVWLGSAVAIAVTPSSTSLGAGQSVQFSASVAGSLNASVSWSLAPQVGTITNGLYTAPVNIDTLQTIVLTVASLADPSKNAQASITLTPSRPTSISLSPAQMTLRPSQSQQFIATVQGGSSNMSWSISPMLGSISPSGLYTAPSTVTDGQEIFVRATLSADPTKTATALVTLASPTPPPPLPPIQLPVEMIGLDGMISTVSFNIPQGSNLTGQLQLYMRIHGLHYQTQASVQVNNSGWLPINSSTVTLLGLANSYGGIGGGFHTLDMTMSVGPGTVVSGTNTVSFKFNGTDGRVSGFRVLEFNVQASDGSLLIPSTAFVYDDPNTWLPPSTQSSDLNAGKTLWFTASLTVPTTSGPVAIRAHCTDCHAQDGRDLKYFNYSNNSIRARSMFHGLTAQQGDQIATYIRNLNVPNPGRPWNPPYQPGPGLDSQPVEQWSAGAGIDAVLKRDADMLPYLAPGGSKASWAPSANMNAREMPIALQLPDWNQWLPGVHPLDAWGNSFLSSTVFTNYQLLRANLKPGDPTSYQAMKSYINLWINNDQAFLDPLTKPTTDPAWNDPHYVASVISTRMWSMTKNWEINQEFALEGMAQTAFGPQADSRAWYSNLPFFGSPDLLHIPAGHNANKTPATDQYFPFIWYQTQLILNYSNNRGNGVGRSIDWPYTLNHINGLNYLLTPSPHPALLTALWLIKGLQVSENGIGPENTSNGWALNVNDPSRFVWFPNTLWSSDLSQTDSVGVMEAYLQLWLAKVTSYTPAQFYQGGWAVATDIPDPNQFTNGIVNEMAYMIPQFHYLGVSTAITDQVIAWAKTIWPNYNWDSTRNAVCLPGTYRATCTW